MNSEARKLIQRRKDETKALGGEAAYRLQALQHLKLKTVVKESHGTPIHTLAFNHVSEDCGNLFATVGADQATIYDDSHMGDYVSVVVHLTNEKSEHAEGGELQTSAWINCKSWTDHPHGDSCLAVSGIDTAISVISVVEARVIKLLKGHTKEVICMDAVHSKPTLLISLSKEGNLRLWDVEKETCLSSIATDAACAALALDGESVVIGTSRGRLYRYMLATGEDGQTALVEGSKEELKLSNGSHSECIDCLRFLPGQKLATKSADGRMYVWNLPSMESTAAWKVPGCTPMGGLASRCLFNATSDGKYIVAGNSTGSCYVFDTADGSKVANVSAIKVSAPVRSCALSDDCRHLVAAVGRGFLFRFEYLGAHAVDAGEGSGDDENKDVNAAAGVDAGPMPMDEGGDGTAR